MQGRYPRRFGKYVLLKPLAKGGMGEIYLAALGEVGGFEKLCVIKKVITEKADRAKANRFLDEAKVVLRLSHSALVTTFDAGDVGGEFYIAMELVEGKDLREVWNRCVRTRQRIPLDVALHVVREVARSLAYVHSYGDLKLVHRDVAPPNILLAYVGDVKLTDFGLARSILKQEHTAPGVVFGRAAYLAPEQARGEVADARTDVYTLGIVLWELLTGQQFLQLAGLDPAAALAIVRHPKLVAPSTRAPWITPALDKVVTKALAADREHRYQTAEELRQALGEVISDVAPRADAGRVAEFLRGIYADTIEEERGERERFLKEVIPQFRANPPPEEPEPPARESSRPSRVYPRVVDAPEVKASTENTPTGTRSESQPGESKPVAEGKPIPESKPALPEPPARPPRSSQSLKLPGLPGLPPTVVPAPPRAAASPNGAPVRPLPVRAPAAPPAPASRSLGARLIGGCRIIRPLVENRVGSVHVGLRAGTTEEVSVRLLELPRGFDEAAVEKVRHDQKRAPAHANLAGVVELVLADGGLVAIGEPLAGIDLATVLREERRLEGGRALDIAMQLCRGVGAAHAAGVLHLHLEPERILVASGPAGDRIKVLDLGLAGQGGGAAAAATDATSALYRAPEQLTGGTGDVRADVYAAAAILYEMITGAAPHASSLDPAARKLIEPVQSPRMFRPEMPVELEMLILSALDRDPASRPPSLSALEEGLAAVSRARESHDDPSAPPAAPPPSPDRRRARREAAFVAIGELLAAGATSPEADLLPPMIESPFDDPDPSGRPTPLNPPTLDLIASVTGPSEPSPPPAATTPPKWQPVHGTPAQATPSFGGAMLARYGAESGEPTKSRAVPIALAVGGVALAVTLALMLLR